MELNIQAVSPQIEEFVARVQPLDLIVFRGGDFVSDAISTLEKEHLGNGDVTHTGLAMTRRLCPWMQVKDVPDVDADLDTIYVWESTLSGPLNDGVFDAETGGTTFGVQFRRLAEVASEYTKSAKANIGWCRLKENPALRKQGESDLAYHTRFGNLQLRVKSAYEKFGRRRYDARPLDLLGALFPFLRPLRNAATHIWEKFSSANTWLFCSEHVACVYIELGIINDATDGKVDGKILDPQDVVPVDFIGFDEDGMIPVVDCPPVWLKQTKRS